MVKGFVATLLSPNCQRQDHNTGKKELQEEREAEAPLPETILF